MCRSCEKQDECNRQDGSGGRKGRHDGGPDRLEMVKEITAELSRARPGKVEEKRVTNWKGGQDYKVRGMLFVAKAALEGL